MSRPLLGIMMVLAVGVLGFVQCNPTFAQETAYDVIIAGGMVIDGTGANRVRADVAIVGGRIAKIGNLSDAAATRRIDAVGLTVAPGFIDLHNHADSGLMNEKLRQNKGFITQGVTTCVFGVDGAHSPLQIRAMTRRFGEQGVGTNYAFYVGHNGVRRRVMRNEARQATPGELEKMKELVRDGMELGAVGLSSGLMYLPGRHGSTEEVIELAKIAAEYGGVYDSHVRDPVKNLVASVAECIEIGEKAGLPPHPAHHKAPGNGNWGKGRELSDLIAAAIERGIDVTVDQYPYDGAAAAMVADLILVPPDVDLKLAGLKGFNPRLTEAETAELQESAISRLRDALGEPALRKKIKDASEQGIAGGYSWIQTVGYGSFRVVVAKKHPQYVDRIIGDIAEDEGVEPFEIVTRLVLAEGRGAKITLGACSEEDVRYIMTRPWTMIASDGGITGFEGGSGHPRSRGTFPRVLGRYVREWGVLTLEEAIRKMTSMPADYLKLTDRGRLAEGAVADIAVFDPATVIDKSDWEVPSRFSEGIIHVFVNGEAVLSDGEMTDATPGEFIKRPGS